MDDCFCVISNCEGDRYLNENIDVLFWLIVAKINSAMCLSQTSSFGAVFLNLVVFKESKAYLCYSVMSDLLLLK